jgi:hypothetical protein
MVASNEKLLRDTEDEGLAAEAAIVAALLAMMAANNDPDEQQVIATISAPITAYALWLVVRMRSHVYPLPADYQASAALADEAVREAAAALADAVKADPELLSGAGSPQRAVRLAHIAATLITTVTSLLQGRLAPLLGFRSRVWRTRLDNKVRDTHRGLEGQRRALGDPWRTTAGNTLRYPGDRTAPPEEWINCRCRLGWSTVEVSTKEAA